MQYVTPASARYTSSTSSTSASSSQLGLGYGSGTRGRGGGYYGPIHDPFSFRDGSNDPVQAAETVYTPRRAEALLTQEMLQLSFTDRNDVQEEIHGVKCLAPEETHDLLRDSLARLNVEIELLPLQEKSAYVRVRTQQEFARTQQQPVPPSYIDTLEFRLRFLRCELFLPKKAAIRMMGFLNVAYDLFGDCAMYRPVRLQDFTPQEKRDCQKARIQLLPQRACGTGRHIICLILDDASVQISMATRHKILLVLTWTIGLDRDTQRHGFIMVFWFAPLSVPAFVNRVFLTRYQNKVRYDHIAVRISTMHICSLESHPFSHVFRSLLAIKGGTYIRTRLKMHTGTAIELLYTLQGYGIPSNHIPLTYTGNVKNAYWKAWMRQRLLIEQNPHDRTNLRLVDVPYLSDILFHRGNRYAAHLGNVKLRERIETKVMEQYVFERKNTTSGRNDTTTANVSTTDPVFLPYRTKSLIRAIIEELQHQSSGTTPVRFLSWVKKGKDDYGRWEQLDSTNDHDKKLIITKAEWLFRECRKSYRKKTTNDWTATGPPRPRRRRRNTGPGRSK